MMVLLELFISFLKIGFASFRRPFDDSADYFKNDFPRLDDRGGGLGYH